MDAEDIEEQLAIFNVFTHLDCKAGMGSMLETLTDIRAT